MSKPTVPKSIDELHDYLLDEFDDYYDGLDISQEAEDLLKERFAFAGQVKLTRWQADWLIDFLCNNGPFRSDDIEGMIDILKEPTD